MPLHLPANEPIGGQAGFSLLEVLIATVILSLTLGVILQGQAGGLATQTANTSRLQAALVADKVLTDFSQPGRLTAGRFRGQEGPWRYEVEVLLQYRLTPAQTKTAIACYVLQIKVYWQEKGRLKSLVARTARLQTENS